MVGISMKNFSLFEDGNDLKKAPLASRMRPLNIDEIVGQQHIIGKDKLLYRAIKADRIESIILYGPPGTGKTTIAKVIANTTNADFCKINATEELKDRHYFKLSGTGEEKKIQEFLDYLKKAGK